MNFLCYLKALRFKILNKFGSVSLENQASECVGSHAGMNRLAGVFSRLLWKFLSLLLHFFRLKVLRNFEMGYIICAQTPRMQVRFKILY